jgi:hypothetical protein
VGTSVDNDVGFHWGLARISDTGAVGSVCTSSALPINLTQTQPSLVFNVGTDLTANPATTTATPTNASASTVNWTVASTCQANAPQATCTPTATSLCLDSGRFSLSAEWRTPQGASGQGQAVTLTDDTGYFWFFDPSNVELIAKTLDGCPVDDAYWVFSGGLTDIDVNLQVTDTITQQSKHYRNPQNTAFKPIQDTAAFKTCSSGVATRRLPAPSATSFLTAAPQSTVGCTESGTTLCLNNNRFQVELSWSAPGGTRGAGNAVKLTSDTGYFWFFDRTNVEMVLKILDGCALGGHYWVFAGGLTDVKTVVKVTDTTTGQVRTYTNPLNTAFAPIEDTQAFNSCP